MSYLVYIRSKLDTATGKGPITPIWIAEVMDQIEKKRKKKSSRYKFKNDFEIKMKIKIRLVVFLDGSQLEKKKKK